VKFKKIHTKAKLIDNLIDNYIDTSKAAFAPLREIEKTVSLIFPDGLNENYGIHKLVFRLEHKGKKLAFKVGKHEAIEKDHKAYKQFPDALRHVYFAKIYWHTKYCLLQEYGAKAEVTVAELDQFRRIASTYGVLDISCDNIRNFKGTLKIVDATVAPAGLFWLWKATDFVTLRLPQPLRRALRKLRSFNIIKGK
jgi:hypothetical protein